MFLSAGPGRCHGTGHWSLLRNSSSRFPVFPVVLCSPPFEPCQLFQPPIPIHIIHKSYGFIFWQLMTACYHLPIHPTILPQCPKGFPWRKFSASFSSQHRRFHSWNFWLLGFRWFCPTGTTCIRWSPRCIGPVWPIAVFGVCPGRDASFNWCRKIGRPSNLAHLTKAWRWLQLDALVLNIFSRVASMNLFIG